MSTPKPRRVKRLQIRKRIREELAEYLRTAPIVKMSAYETETVTRRLAAKALTQPIVLLAE
jgi:hypothetical protein